MHAAKIEIENGKKPPGISIIDIINVIIYIGIFFADNTFVNNVIFFFSS